LTQQISVERSRLGGVATAREMIVVLTDSQPPVILSEATITYISQELNGA
jgi:hypothetical protein